MKKHKCFSRTTLSLSLTALLLTTVNIHAETVSVNGTPGVSGADSDGINSGGDGGAGGKAIAEANAANDLLNSASAFGQNGGGGGNGVNGDTVRSFDGGDSGAGGDAEATATLTGSDVETTSFAMGGDGGRAGTAGILGSSTEVIFAGFNGDGGKGGDAVADANSISTGDVRASSSAFGGNGGIAGVGGLNSTAGNSGDGGSAIARAFATTTGVLSTQNNIASATARAFGGKGAQGIGEISNDNLPSGSGNGGAGGSASVQVSGNNDTGSLVLSAIQAGGDGGQGSLTGIGGNGADSIIIDAVSGSAFETFRMSQSSSGGDAGGSGQSGGAVGLAGDATSSFTLSNLSALNVEGRSTAFAGDGGLAINTRGSDGGDAIASISLSGRSNVNVTAEAFGGTGGAYRLTPRAVGGGAGNGGSASLGGVGGVYGQSTAGGDVSVTGRATGGNGSSFSAIFSPSGHAGTGGNGGSVNLNNSVDGDTTGSLTLLQEAFAGASGRGSNERFAGTATSILSKDSSSSRLSVTANATGGSGTSAEPSGTASDGGRALVNVSGTNDAGTLLVVGAANAGGGGGNSSTTVGGAGGDARNTAFGSNSGIARGLSVRGSATGGSGGFDSSFNDVSLGGNGGNAVSRSTAIGAGDPGGTVGVSDVATGGRGRIGGSASSFASGRGVGQTSVSAIANSGDGFVRSGDALSRAEAESTGIVGATSRARVGFFEGTLASGQANASSVATGAAGGVLSVARVDANNFRDRVVATANTSVAGSFNSNSVIATSRTDANASIGGAIADFSRGDGMQAATFATLLPNQVSANAIIAGNANIEANLADKEALVVGFMAASYSENGNSRGTFLSEIDLAIDMRGKADTDFLLGLFDSSSQGDHGFDTLSFSVTSGRNRLENILFNDLAAAESYFNDNTLNFGLWSELIGPGELLNLTISLSLVEQHLGQGFSAGFAAAGGAAAVVPVPAAVWLFGSGLLGLIAVARKRD